MYIYIYMHIYICAYIYMHIHIGQQFSEISTFVKSIQRNFENILITQSKVVA